MSTISITHPIQQRITSTVFISQSLFAAAIITAFTLTPIIAVDLSGSEAAAGLPSTLTLMGRAIAAYPIGVMMDKIGRRAGLSTGFMLAVLGSIFSVAAIIAGSFAGFCIGAAIIGMGRAAADQGRYIAAEVYPADRQAKVIGMIVFAGTIGAIVGPLLVPPSTNLAESLGFVGFTGPFLAGAVLNAIALITVYAFLRPDPLNLALASEVQTNEQAIPARPLRQIFRQPTVILATASMIIGQMVMTMLMVITPLHMHHYDHSAQAISFVIMAHTLGMFGLSGVTGWLIDKYGRVPLIISGAIILIIASIMTPLSTNVPTLALALFLLGLGWNFCYVAGSSLLSDSLSTNERGKAQGTSELMVSVSSGLGGLVTGALFAAGGMTAVGAVGLASTLALVASLVGYGLNRKHGD